MDEKPATSVLYSAMVRAFWYGMAFSTGFHMFVQDWLGLEGYIAMVREKWVELHWLWGLLFCAGGLTFWMGMLGRFHWLNECEKEKEDGRSKS